jgi:hypothetical protein
VKAQDRSSQRSHDPGSSAEFAIAAGKQTLSEAAALSPDGDGGDLDGGADRSHATPGHRGAGQRAGDWLADDGLMSAMGLGDYEVDQASFSPGSPAGDVAGGASGGAVPGALAFGEDTASGAKATAQSAASPGPAAAGAAGPAAPAGAKAAARPGAKGAAAPAAAKPAKKAPPVPVPSTKEPSQHATWTDVSSAAEKPGQEALDIEWINALPAPIRDSIDAKFSEGRRDQAVRRKISSATRAIDQEHKKRKQQLRDEAAARIDPDRPKRVRAAVIDADPDYVAAVQALAAEMEAKKKATGDEVKDAYDTQQPVDHPEESVTTPAEATVPRLEGVARARTDFMSWAIEMTGSAEKVKAHYHSIREVKGRHGLWLAADAAVRMEAALANFEAAHPGYTFGSAGGHSMRDLHQQRKGVGMQGHSLAFAIDVLAYDNPNLKVEKGAPGPINEFYLERFGKDAAGKSRATMSLPNGDQRIEALGKHTAAGATTPADEQFVQDIRTQFAEISATSQRFQAGMAKQLPKLQEARNMYFSRKDLEVQISQLQKEQINIAALAEKQLAKEKFSGDAAAKAARLAQIEEEMKASFSARLTSLVDKFSATDLWRTLMDQAFADWKSTLSQDAATISARLNKAEALEKSSQAALLELKGIKNDVPQLTAFASSHGIPTEAGSSPSRLRKNIEQALRKRKQDSDQQVAYSTKEIGVLNYAIKRLDDEQLVFGQGHKNADGTYSTQYKVSEVPLIQYLEHGNIRDDAMPVADSKGGRKGVFNADVVATLARYGFAPGSTFGDTMHFDFIEGYSKTVPGGRSQPNMRKNRYGPRGTVTEEKP